MIPNENSYSTMTGNFIWEILRASTVDYNDKNWGNVDLPYDWSIEGKVDPDNPTGNDGGYFPAGIGW